MRRSCGVALQHPPCAVLSSSDDGVAPRVPGARRRERKEGRARGARAAPRARHRRRRALPHAAARIDRHGDALPPGGRRAGAHGALLSWRVRSHDGGGVPPRRGVVRALRPAVEPQAARGRCDAPHATALPPRVRGDQPADRRHRLLQQPADTPAFDRVRDAALASLRAPISTALVAAIGFVPAALATGAGAEVQRPLATVVIFGLSTSMVLSLLALPAMLLLVERRRRA